MSEAKMQNQSKAQTRRQGQNCAAFDRQGRHLLRVAKRHVMQPAGSCHGITDRRARESAKHARHARRLSQSKYADWSPAAGGWGVQRGTASVLGNWGEVHHARL